MSQCHRLRPLQVRVARHRRIRFLRRPLENRSSKCGKRFFGLDARICNVETEGSSDLIVARAPGVNLSPEVAELGLDVRVHVLGRRIDGVEAAERVASLGELRVVENPRSVQPLGV